MISSRIDLAPTVRLAPAAVPDGDGGASDPGSGQTVLVVDDERIVRDVLALYLERDGFRTLQAADGAAARDFIAREAPSIVILDVVMPGVDGLDLCRWIRSVSQVPIIVLSARGDEADRILGLEVGADDYVVKPFSPREIACRVRNILRRVEPSDGPTTRMSFGGLTIDAATHDVSRDGREVSLTAREFDLLHFLASHPRQVFSRDLLMDRIWGYRGAVDTGTVSVHVRRIRMKIEVDPAEPLFLQTVWGVGYRFVPPAPVLRSSDGPGTTVTRKARVSAITALPSRNRKSRSRRS